MRTSLPRRSAAARLIPFLLLAALAVTLGGCLDELDGSCQRVTEKELIVAKDKSCAFRFGARDPAKYVVVITQPPRFGTAEGDRHFLRYTAKAGWVGEDQVKIRVERRGIGHVQWQTLTVSVRVAANT